MEQDDKKTGGTQMLKINRLTMIFLNFILVSLFCGLMSIQTIHAQTGNQPNATSSEQTSLEQREYFSYTRSGERVDYGILSNEFVVQFKEEVTQEQIDELKRVAPDMLEEWSRTKKAPRHAAWLHELEFRGTE